MRHYKKIIAAIAATVLTVSTTATGVTAFADELEKDAYLAGIEDVETQEIVEYYLDNGLSIDEAQAMLDVYEDGMESISDTSVLSGSGPFDLNTNFYNATESSQNPHYGVIIMDNGEYGDSATVKVTYNTSYVSTTGDYTVFDEGLTGAYNLKTTNFKVTGDMGPYNTTGASKALMEFTFNGLSTSISEANLYNSFTTSVLECESFFGGDSTFSFATYVQGDIDHDGKVTSTDSAYLNRFLVHLITNLSFTYKDVKDGVAGICVYLSLDANRDGKIDILDVNWINSHLDE
jgi:hypothetical protein